MNIISYGAYKQIEKSEQPAKRIEVAGKVSRNLTSPDFILEQPLVYPTPKINEIDLANIKNNFDKVMVDLEQIFQSAFNKTFGEFSIDEVEAHVEVTAEGKVGLLGSGMGLQGSTGIKLVFKKVGKNKSSTK